ncbi:MAG: ribbon-helix-helix domain-containing protein [Acidobacteriaceae bacterium]
MRVKPSQTEIHNAQSKTVVRASITFPPDLYEALEKIALQKKVSLAWVVRDASERYVAEETTEAVAPRPGKR